MPSHEDHEGLHRRLRSALDGIDVPDVWDEASNPARPHLSGGRNVGAKRIGALAVGVVVSIFSVAALLQLSPMGGSEPTPKATEVTLSTSAMLKDLPEVRCTASAPAAVQPGALFNVSYTLENTSNESVKVSGFPPSYPLVVQAADGSSWNTADLMNHSWPYMPGESLSAGGSRVVEAKDLTRLYVQFPGPLSVTPTCEGQQLDPLRVEVSAAGGAAPSPDSAMSRAANATSGLFGQCMPQADRPTIGTIGPPPSSDLSAFVAWCSADVQTWDGFSVVTFVIVAPAGEGPSTVVPSGLAAFTHLPTPPGGSNGEVVVWRFVVPSEGKAMPVGSGVTVASTPSQGYERWFDVSSADWRDGGTSLCGGTGGGGGSGASATVVFFDDCGE